MAAREKKNEGAWIKHILIRNGLKTIISLRSIMKQRHSMFIPCDLEDLFSTKFSLILKYQTRAKILVK